MEMAEISDFSDYAKQSIIFSYVSRWGSKITDRKCSLDPDNVCDMLCSDFKIKFITNVTSNGRVLHAACFCTKFEPPLKLEVLKVHPLDEEKKE